MEASGKGREVEKVNAPRGKGRGARAARVSERGSILLERHNPGPQRAGAGSPKQPALTRGVSFLSPSSDALCPGHFLQEPG